MKGEDRRLEELLSPKGNDSPIQKEDAAVQPEYSVDKYLLMNTDGSGQILLVFNIQ